MGNESLNIYDILTDKLKEFKSEIQYIRTEQTVLGKDMACVKMQIKIMGTAILFVSGAVVSIITTWMRSK